MGVYEAIKYTEQHEQQASSSKGSEIIPAPYLEFYIRNWRREDAMQGGKKGLIAKVFLVCI